MSDISTLLSAIRKDKASDETNPYGINRRKRRKAVKTVRPA
jgi:hypothetical protein